MRYTYPNVPSGSSNYVREGAAFTCEYQLPGTTTWTAVTACTEDSLTTHFQFTVQANFLSSGGGIIQSVKIRFGRIRVPDNSGINYTGPTIVLNPGGASPQTYTGASQYPRPVPPTLNASLSSDISNPGRIATYTL